MTINEYRVKSKDGGFDTSGLSDAEMLLNPKSFQAVGKVEGWGGRYYSTSIDTTDYKCLDCGFGIENVCEIPVEFIGRQHNNCKNPRMWEEKMHDMIDALIDGKSIEDYLATL